MAQSRARSTTAQHLPAPMTPALTPTATLPRGFMASLVLAGLGGNMVGALGTPLIPTVSRVYGVALDSAQWTLTISLLVGVVLTPLVGRLADGGARKRLLVILLCLIVAGGVIAAVAPTFPLVMFGRALEGLGYAIIPLAVGIVREHLNGPKLAGSLIALSLSLSVGSGIGNPAVGLIVRYTDYHGAFWFAAAVSALSLLWILKAVPADGRGEARVRFDLLGAVVLSVALVSVLLSISRGETWGWGSPRVLALSIGGIVVLAGWVVFELKVSEPLVDLRLALNRAVLAANLSALLIGMAMFAATSLISRLVQTPRSVPYGLGGDTFTSGILLLMTSLGSLASQKITNAISRRLGLAAVLPCGGVMVFGALVLMAFEHSSLWQLGVVMFICGVGLGMTFAVTPALIVANVPGDRAASATGLNTLIRLLGGALGSAMSAAILAAHTPAGAHYPAERGFTIGCLIAAVFGAATAIIGAILVRGGRSTEEGAVEAREPVLGVAGPDGIEYQAIAEATYESSGEAAALADDLPTGTTR
jgi:MFS family permease